MDTGDFGLFDYLLTGTLLALYFLPAILAVFFHKDIHGRRKPKKAWPLIVALNLFSGWTILGWFIALLWARLPDSTLQILKLEQVRIHQLLREARYTGAALDQRLLNEAIRAYRKKYGELPPEIVTESAKEQEILRGNEK
jgi:hypothetical protein